MEFCHRRPSRAAICQRTLLSRRICPDTRGQGAPKADPGRSPASPSLRAGPVRDAVRQETVPPVTDQGLQAFLDPWRGAEIPKLLQGVATMGPVRCADAPAVHTVPRLVHSPRNEETGICIATARGWRPGDTGASAVAAYWKTWPSGDGSIGIVLRLQAAKGDQAQGRDHGVQDHRGATPTAWPRWMARPGPEFDSLRPPQHARPFDAAPPQATLARAAYHRIAETPSLICCRAGRQGISKTQVPLDRFGACHGSSTPRSTSFPHHGGSEGAVFGHQDRLGTPVKCCLRGPTNLPAPAPDSLPQLETSGTLGKVNRRYST